MNFCACVGEKSYMLVVAHQGMRGSAKSLCGFADAADSFLEAFHHSSYGVFR